MTTARSNTEDTGNEPEYIDTVALLQEEIDRLESELRLRDEMMANAPTDLDSDNPAAVEGLERRIAELTGEVAERDQLIEQLWEHLSDLEEVESASREEWEQLHSWVEELERRIEAGQGTEAGSPDELDDERRRSDALRAEFEADRRSWEARQGRLEEEVEELRARLAEARQASGEHPESAELEAENRKLRDECRRLAGFEATAAEVGPLRGRLRDALYQIDRYRQELEKASDELEQARMEHQAELIALRTQMTREKLGKPTEGLSPNDRVRVLREHLREIHEHEQQERKERQLSTRLSKMWHRMGSSR